MRTSILSISLLSLALAGFSSCQETTTDAPAKKPADKKAAVETKVTDIKIKLTTSKGVIEGTIFASKTQQVPTPPDATSTKIVSPALSSPRVKSMRWAVP